MTKQDNNNAKKSEATRKQRNIKNNDSHLVVDWIIDRVGGISMGEKKEENDKEKKKKIVKQLVSFSKLCVNKKIRRHSF
jgi:hypothetical protein